MRAGHWRSFGGSLVSAPGSEAPVLVRAAWLTALALLLDAVAAEGDLLRSRRGANSLKSAGQLEHGGLPSEA